MTARDELQQWVDGVDATHEDGLADLTHDVIPVDLARRVLAEMDKAHTWDGVMALLDEHAVMNLPEPNFYTADEELEWSYDSVNSDGIVNLGIHDGGVELSIAHDLGQSDAGLPTVAEGFIPLSLLRQTAAALLAAADAAEGKTHDHH